MSRRKPKIFPPGTFLPHRQRLLAIMQLCISFSLILWYLAQPFMGEYFDLRSRMILYEYVMGTSDVLKTKGEEPKLLRQAARFKLLDDQERELILTDYKKIQDMAQRPVLTKLTDGLKVLFVDIPAFEVAWLFFSIVIAILLLLKVEGAKHAVWILPLLVLAYAIDNRLEGKVKPNAPDQILFPSEQMIASKYLKEPMSTSLAKQKAQLQDGWEEYLLDKWLPINEGKGDRTAQVEQAEFNFTVARLILLHDQSPVTGSASFREYVATPWLILYMAWNLLFGWMMSGDQARLGLNAKTQRR